MEYSLPYVLLFTFLGACAFLYESAGENEKRKNCITIIAAIVFLFFFGLRGYIYTDWTYYTEFFRKAEFSLIYKFDLAEETVHEPGFVMLTVLCKSLFGSYFSLQFACTAIFLILFIRFCRQFGIQNLPLILMIFIPMEGTVLILNLLRNTISIGILLNSLIYIKERRLLPYLTLCFLALLFHLSSIFFFPLYFFLHKRTNKWLFVGLVSFFFIFYLSKVSIIEGIVKLLALGGALGTKAEAYTELYTTPRVFNPSGTVEKFLLVSLLFIFYDEIIEKFKNRMIIVNSLLLYFFMYYIFGEFRTLSERMALLFAFAQWVIWVDLINILVIKNNKILLSGFIFLYCLYMTAVNINEPDMEYDNILIGAKTEAQRRQVFFKIVQDDQ